MLRALATWNDDTKVSVCTNPAAPPDLLDYILTELGPLPPNEYSISGVDEDTAEDVWLAIARNPNAASATLSRLAKVEYLTAEMCSVLASHEKLPPDAAERIVEVAAVALAEAAATLSTAAPALGPGEAFDSLCRSPHNHVRRAAEASGARRTPDSACGTPHDSGPARGVSLD